MPITGDEGSGLPTKSDPDAPHVPDFLTVPLRVDFGTCPSTWRSEWFVNHTGDRAAMSVMLRAVGRCAVILYIMEFRRFAEDLELMRTELESDVNHFQQERDRQAARARGDLQVRKTAAGDDLAALSSAP